jgi:hypothetical protein
MGQYKKIPAFMTVSRSGSPKAKVIMHRDGTKKVFADGQTRPLRDNEKVGKIIYEIPENGVTYRELITN